jgi:hypothetical protein
MSLVARSTMTAVFPDPAPADTSMFLPRSVIACSCSAVHFFSAISHTIVLSVSFS